jgi:hypothetical protein
MVKVEYVDAKDLIGATITEADQLIGIEAHLKDGRYVRIEPVIRTETPIHPRGGLEAPFSDFKDWPAATVAQLIFIKAG